MCMGVRMYTCTRTKDESWVPYFRILSTLFCETGSLVDLEFTGLARLTGQGVPEILLALPPQYRD